MKQNRLDMIDTLRGLAILSMIGFHACWILNFFGIGISTEMLQSMSFIVWERSICCTFIFVSGFAFNLGRHQLKNGLMILGISIGITILTVVFLYDARIIFGVLTLIGTSYLLTIGLNRVIGKSIAGSRAVAIVGFIIAMLLVIGFWNINRGYLGIEGIYKIMLPRTLYKGYLMTFLGFQAPGFYSSDYFSILPWYFLYCAGYFFWHIVNGTSFERNILTKGIPYICAMGRKSLIIYLIHPVILFIAIYIISISI